MQPARITLLLVGASLSLACAGARPPARVPSAPAPIAVAPVVIRSTEALLEARVLEARAHTDAGRFSEAALEFHELLAEHPEVDCEWELSWGWAVAADEIGDFTSSAEGFRRLVSTCPHAPHARAATVRAVRLLAHLERWQEAAELAREFLRRYNDPRPLELIGLRGALAMDASRQGDDVTAAREVERARGLIDQHQLDVPGRIHRDLALVYFALGEVRRLRAERIVLRERSGDFADALEARCRFILDAQTAYSDAMRAHDAHWSTMAGVRVATLYSDLHVALLEVPPPPNAEQDPERRQLFEGAMRLRYSVLIEKALNLLEQTLRVAEREQIRGEWVERANAAVAELRKERATEEEALAKLPYTREQLEQALARLAKSSAHGPKARP